MSPGDLETVLDRVSERVTPDADERARMEAVAAEVISRIEAALADLPVDGDAIQVGSTARNTWMSGDRDVDVFVRFSPQLDRADLEAYGLEVGRSVLPEGREEYAEHPYVTGDLEGFDVDVVPCYRVDDPTAIRSAVDRTPFHTEYLADNLGDSQAAEVRVFKRFLQGIGAYGSDLRTRGFSGYLAELLVLVYGDAEGVFRAAAAWQPPVELDPAEHGEASFDDPLIVIDPTDPERNVAAVVSPENVARVQHFARELLADPEPSVFYPSEPPTISPTAVRAAIDQRGTDPIAIVFETPDLVEDQLYPQLRRSRNGLVRGLAEAGFETLRATTFADDEQAVILVEPRVGELPAVDRHEGPPIHVREHAERFYEGYADAEVTGPFIDGDRYVVEREREYRTAAAYVEAELQEVSLGVHVSEALQTDYEVLVGTAVADLAPRFGTELGRYFHPSPRD